MYIISSQVTIKMKKKNEAGGSYMDHFEFEEDKLPQEPEYIHSPNPEDTQPIPAAEIVSGGSYSGAGAGRKESPFADSPYVVNHQYRDTAPKSENASGAAKREKKKRGAPRRILAAVLSLAVLAGSCGITAALVNSRWEKKTAQMESSFSQQIGTLQKQIEAMTGGTSISGTPVSSTGMTPSQVYSANVPSVVQVTCDVVTNYGYGQSAAGTSVGSGFILTEDGYIVTNYHVIEGATSVSITTYLGDHYEAQVVGYESANDVAVLKVEGQDMAAVTIGSSSDLIVGDQVVAIGNALGELTGTMTVGYVSAKDRDVTTDGTTINMIQTDAAINSGNSGGPLFNMKGEVVGITTAKYSGESSSGATIEGIGFAIPIDDVLSMVEDLVNLGYITGAYLGVGVNDVDSAAQFYGIPAGAYVAEVNEGSCAEKAGVAVGDIIIALGEYKVESYSDLRAALRKFDSGDTTTIKVYRSGQELILTITLDEKPQTEESEVPAGNGGTMPEDGSFEEWYNFIAPFFGN